MALNKEFEKIGYDIIGAAFDVRKEAGSLFREHYYECALTWELRQRGHTVDSHVKIPVIYKGMVISDSYEADLIVDNKVILELKAIKTMREEECRQLLSYLKLMDCKLGYLINFGASDFKLGKTHEQLPYKFGIYRFVNGL